MRKNVGTLDRVLRALIGIGLIFLAWLYLSDSILIPLVFGVLGILFIITAISGSCTVYRLLNISTNKQIESEEQDNNYLSF